MADFQPPPTYANPVIVNEQTGQASFNPVWLKWFVDLAGVLDSFGGGSGSADHNSTTGKQGGTTGQFYHTTQTQHTDIVRSTAIRSVTGNTGVNLLTDGTLAVLTAGVNITLPLATAAIIGKTISVVMLVAGTCTVTVGDPDSGSPGGPEIFMVPGNPQIITIPFGTSMTFRCGSALEWFLVDHVYVHDHTTADTSGPLTNDEHDGFMEIATSATPTTPASGKMRIYAQDASGVARLRALHSTGSDLAFFRDAVVRVKNTSGGTINKGELAYISGATGNFPTIAKAKANAASTMPCSGMVLATAADNTFTTLQLAGEMTGLDTSAFSEGARIYVSETTAGGLTATEPLYPYFSQQVAVVTKANAGDGRVHLMVSLYHEGDDSGSNRNTFSVGDGAAGTKTLAFVGAATGNLQWDGTNLSVGAPLKLKSYTVAGLPAAGTVGRIACVTDALAPAFGAVVAAGGAVKIPVFDDGTNWIVA